ncbi:MAG TPA: hypothetical protein VH107_19910 [Lacipirellulaceae bacterium]|jgi:hypothetical protein|nr:hypothetical protein [Lacipirellulaceae bacterium]
MSMVPLGGLLSSTAGTALSQVSGSETERTQKDSLTQRRGIDADQHAERSSGIGQTEQDQQSSERDADGRRLWENPAAAKKAGPLTAEAEVEARQSKDATGQSGTQLDLTG